MTDEKPIRIRRHDLPFGIVPQSLIEDERLSPTARLIAVWFCVQSSNWELRVRQMRKVLSIGKDADLAARRQLKQFGYLKVKQKMMANGIFGHHEYEFDPAPPRRDDGPVAGFSAAGSPAAGPAGAGKASHITNTKETAQEEQQPPPQGTAAQPQPQGGGDLIFPGQLAAGDRATCVKVMQSAGLEMSVQQLLLDELQGALRSGRAVTKPAGWIRRLASLYTAGTLVFEHADQVAETRRAQAAHLLRLADIGTPTSTRSNPPRNLDEWRKQIGIPPRRNVQVRGLDETSS